MKGPYYIRKRPDLPMPPVLPCPDWAGIVLALRAKGVSLNGLAAYIGRSREHVYSLLAGTRTPEWSSGQLLLNLAKEMGVTTGRGEGEMYEVLKARLLAWTKTSNAFGLDSISKDISKALETIEQLERQLVEITAQKASLMLEQTMRKAGEQSNIKLLKQLAERDAELQKYREAPVVAWLAPNGLSAHMGRAMGGKPLIVKPGEQ